MAVTPLKNAGHKQIDHTADLALEIWADTEEELCAEVARAVVAIMTEAASVQAAASREVSIDGVDREDRFVQWINEIIVLAVTDGFLVAESIVSLQTTSLAAVLRGQPGSADLIRGELKSATYHDLVVEERDGGFWARVVIDV